MKILALHSHVLKDQNKVSAVDGWRIKRPISYLKKHTDWQIDERASLIPEIEKYKDESEFTEEEMEKAFKNVCEYDIVFSSYSSDRSAYTMLKVARDKAGTKYIMDVDDDMFSVNPDNPFWMKMSHENCHDMQLMIRDNDFITTTTPRLARVFNERREQPNSSVFVVPNFIDSNLQHPEFKNDEIVIGYFGGSSHYYDIHDSGVGKALRDIAKKHKNVKIKFVGIPLDVKVPKKQYEFHSGLRGDQWDNELFPTLRMDIVIAPLLDNVFNYSKSNIKWQEATRAGAAFIASDIGPYADLDDSLLVKVEENTRAKWFAALDDLVTDDKKRKQLIDRSRKELEDRWLLENNWKRYKKIFEQVYEAN